MNLHEFYQPMILRNMETMQVQYLARKFDFGKESRVARLIVHSINDAMDAEDREVGIERIRPFELLVKKNHKYARLPLFLPEYLEPIFKGETFKGARKVLQARCMEQLKTAMPEAEEKDLLRIIYPWSLVRYAGPGKYIDQLKNEAQPYDKSDTHQWQEFIQAIKPGLPTERMQTPDLSASENVLRELTTSITNELNFGTSLVRYMVEEIITLRNVCCPRVETLIPGQMPLITTHVNAPLSEEIATEYRRHTPIIITVWTPEELRQKLSNVPRCIETLKRRIIRVCFEAYRQNGLLSLQQLQWIFQVSSARISELIRSFQNEHNIIVPTPGTVLDSGRSMTHKDIIVRLHLDGHSVSEISRITHHSPRSVDNYIGTFESVLILCLFSVPTPLMSRLLQKGSMLINEYLQLIEEFYTDKDQIKTYLQHKGVKF